jgi:hypothetical protein
MWLNKAIYFLSIYDEGSKDTSNIVHTLEHSGLKWWSYGLKGITLPHDNMVAFVSALKRNKIFYP